MRSLLAAAALLPVLLQAPPASTVERFTLDNGLRVAIRPVEGAALASVTVLFDFGEDADPEGRSGLAHLCEHLYCTAPAGKEKAAPVEALVKSHPGGWNAQTGWDYTVFSYVVTPAALEGELADAARRMGALAPAAEDLERERPRLLEELGNMYGRSPSLAAWNLARAALDPARPGRAGGLPEEVCEVRLDEAVAFLRAKYRPARARLIVAGAVDPAVCGPRIRELFGALPPRADAGPAPAKARVPEAGRPGGSPLQGPPSADSPPPAVRVVPTGPDGFRQGAQACIGWRAPRPGDADYPAFLVLALRLWTRQARGTGEVRERPLVVFAPLDDPDHLLVRAGMGKDETPDAAAKRVEAFVREAIDPALRAGEEKAVKVQLANLLGTLQFADAMVAQNPYLVGFGLGRRDQLGVDGAALAKALDAVTDEALAAARKKWFGEPVRVAAVPD